MVQKLKYDPKYAKAMKYIFGKTLICRNLECATELGKQFHLDCVTLEGDQVSNFQIFKFISFIQTCFYKSTIFEDCKRVKSDFLAEA